jgi:hypothetical protein
MGQRGTGLGVPFLGTQKWDTQPRPSLSHLQSK